MSIIERLRAGEACIDAGGKMADCSAKEARSGCLCATAADEIERLLGALASIKHETGETMLASNHGKRGNIAHEIARRALEGK